MIGTTNSNQIKIVGGTISSTEMSNITVAQATWRYKDVSFSGFSRPPIVLTTLKHTNNSGYGYVSTLVQDTTINSARILIAYNISNDVEKVNWIAVGI